MLPSADSRIASLRERLEGVHDAMLGSSTDSIEQSVSTLTGVAEELVEIAQEIAGQPPTLGLQRDKLLDEVRRLRADVSRLASLTVQGLEFCRKWSNAIQSAAGYLANGESAKVAGPASIFVRG